MKAKVNNNIKQTQLVLLMIVVISGGKFLSLPGLMAHYAGRDSWISMCILFAVDLVCLIFILWAIRLNRGLSFGQILSSTLSTPVAKVIFALYAAFFCLRVTGGLMDTLELISSSLSVVTNWVSFVVPVLLVIGFNVVKGARNVGRVAQIFFFFIFASVLAILVLSLGHTDMSNLKPCLADGMGVAVNGALGASFWFADSVFVLFLMGGITKSNLFSVKVGGAFAVGAAITVLLDAIYLALFGNIAEFGTSALAKVSGFNITGSLYGRLDWIFVVIWLSSIILKCTIFLWAATTAVGFIAEKHSPKAYAVIFAVISAVIVALPLFVPVKTIIIEFFCQSWGKYLAAVVQYALPLAMPLLTFFANKKQGAARQTRHACGDE